MSSINPIDYKNIQSLITEGAVAESQMPLTAVTESINFHFDKIGSAIVRPGITLLGQQLSGKIYGLYQFNDILGNNSRILTVNNGNVYYLSGSTWTVIASVTAALKTRFTTFLNQIFMVDGIDATKVWDGSLSDTFNTNNSASGAPIGKFIDTFRTRVWIAGNPSYPDRLYYSSIADAASVQSIVWYTDPTNMSSTNQTVAGWFDVSPADGDTITAIKRCPTALVVFKKNHIYRVYSVSESEPDPTINVGTWSAESIVEAKDGLYFHSPTGFFNYTGQSGLSEISRPIIDIVHAIPLSSWSSVTGWADDDHVYWSVGTVTYNGVTYNNMVVRYTNSTQVWTHYSYPTQFIAKSDYYDSTMLHRLVGDTNGNIFKTNEGTTDNGLPINYSLVHRWTNIDGYESTNDNITSMCFAHQHGTGTKVQWQKNNDLTNDWASIDNKTLGSFDTLYTGISIKGRRVRFKLSGTSTGGAPGAGVFEYKGFELSLIDSEPIKF